MDTFWLLPFLVVFVTVGGELTAEFLLKEEVKIPYLIGNIADACGLTDNLSTEELISMRYNLLGSAEHQSMFNIEKKTGDIYGIKRLDREEKCGFRENCRIDLKVAVFSTVLSRFNVVTTKLTIIDINDNSPLFPSNKTELEISESTPLSSSFVVDRAVDIDSTSENSVTQYTLSPEGTPFTLNINNNSDGDLRAYLILQHPLDREINDTYELTITAHDGGSPSKTDNLTIVIKILDINDNAPVFKKTSYELSIAENTLPNASLMHVSAMDKDINENGVIRYRFGTRSDNLDIVKKYFSIDSRTGDLKLLQSVVYKSGETVDIVVEAIDDGQPPRIGYTTIHVRIVDVGNNPPNVDINFLSSAKKNEVILSELASVGTLVAFLKVEDLDVGDNGLVTCDVNDTTFALQTLANGGYLLVTRDSLDHELKDVYKITIDCRDNGTPAMNTLKFITIRISDENDNAPILSKAMYFVSIMENNRIGEFVTQISAQDKDSLMNAKIQFSVHKDAQGHVAIDKDTGMIKAIRRFDRETIPQYNFTVYATDQGKPPRSSSATIMMKIADQNDNIPIFKTKKYHFFVLENMASGIKIGRLSASDLDEGVNQNVLFSGVASTLRHLPFAVYQDGTIRTTEQLDREVTQTYKFLVRAFDLGSPSLSSTATVVVRVADDNDNAPIITFPAKSNQTLTIPFPANNGKVLVHIQAFDLDEAGPNSKLLYTIAEGNEMNIFDMNGNSGAISLKSNIDIVKDEEFKLKISVKDNGFYAKETTTDITIALKRFNETDSSLSIDDGSRNAIVVTAVVALTIIGIATALTVICIIRRNAQKAKADKIMNKEAYADELLKPKRHPVPYRDITSTGTSTDIPEKSKVKVSFSDEDLDNMELYNSTGTSAVFTDTLIESQKMMSYADDDSDSGHSGAHDSGRGGSYLDIQKLDRIKKSYNIGPIIPQDVSSFTTKDTVRHIEII